MAEENNVRLCSSCGAPLRPGARFCEECGTPVPEIPVTPPQPAAPEQPAPQQPAQTQQPVYGVPYAAPQQPAQPQQPAYVAPQQPAQPQQPPYAAPQQPNYNASYRAPQQSAAPQQPYGAPHGAPQQGYPQQNGYAPGQYPPPQKKKSLAWLFILIGALVLIAAAAVVVFVVIKPFDNKTAPTDPTTVTAPSESTEKPTDAPTTEPTDAPATEPTDAPTEATTEPPQTTATPSSDYDSYVIGTWYINGYFDYSAEGFEEIDDRSYSTATLYADHTGVVNLDGDTYQLTWSFDEVDEDGDYAFDCYIDGDPSTMYYTVEYEEMWLYTGDYMLTYER